MPSSRESALPPSWQTAAAKDRWWKRVAEAPHSVLMLDYDGTLAPFKLDRMEALPYPGIEERLSRLLALERSSVVLVTGRSRREIGQIYPASAQMEVWASHGWEHAFADGQYYMAPLREEQKAILHDLMHELEARRLPASAVERKPASIAIHWRGLEPSEQDLLRRSALKPFERFVPGGEVELLPFEDGVELRATGRTKGDAVRDLRSRFSMETPIAYLGDDHTDEEAFGAMDPADLALLVRPAPRGTLADYWMAAPEGVLEFLDGWIEALAEGK